MKIVLLGRDEEYTGYIYHSISKEYPIEWVITEDPVPRTTFLKKRIKRLGICKVFGQVCFQFFIVPIIRKQASSRKEEIIRQYELTDDRSFIDKGIYTHFDNANSKECINKVKELNPDIVVVNGTRILSEDLINCCDAVFINAHMGITPKYRGSHGAYWAVYNDDIEHAGVTVHLIDKGIDTGGIIYQENISITDQDNFTTYPLLQIAKAIELEKKALHVFSVNHKFNIITNDLESSIYSHPTFIQYLSARIRRNVK